MTDSAEPILEPRGNQRLKELWAATQGKAAMASYRAALEAEVLELYAQRDRNRQLLDLAPKLVAALDEACAVMANARTEDGDDADLEAAKDRCGDALAEARVLQGDREGLQ